MIENSHLPAFSKSAFYHPDGGIDPPQTGLTKHEYACIKLGIPETGDPVLDDLILKSERKRIAAMAMSGSMANQNPGSIPQMCKEAVFAADELIKALNEQP